MNVKILVRVSTFTCAAVLIAAQILASAQQLDPTMPGALFGYVCVDADSQTGAGHDLYRIDLTNGVAELRGATGVGQELEGFLSADGFAAPNTSELFGVAEAPDGTGPGGPSVLVNVTDAALAIGNTGSVVGTTGIEFGTEAGAAYDFLGDQHAYSIAADDLTRVVAGQQYPATRLYEIDLSTGVATPLNTTEGLYLDGLAYGANGELYATDARLTDALYRFNFAADPNGDGVAEGQWEPVGTFNTGEDFNEDSGLANYRGLNGDETHLYMVTEGDGPRLGRLWTVDFATGQATFVGELRIGSTTGPEVPEDVEAFDIPYLPLRGQM